MTCPSAKKTLIRFDILLSALPLSGRNVPHLYTYLNNRLRQTLADGWSLPCLHKCWKHSYHVVTLVKAMHKHRFCGVSSVLLLLIFQWRIVVRNSVDTKIYISVQVVTDIRSLPLNVPLNSLVDSQAISHLVFLGLYYQRIGMYRRTMYDRTRSRGTGRHFNENGKNRARERMLRWKNWKR